MPKKTRITAATTPATSAIIESSSELALLVRVSIGRILAQAQGGPGGRQDVVRAGDEEDAAGQFGGEPAAARNRGVEVGLLLGWQADVGAGLGEFGGAVRTGSGQAAGRQC